MENKERIEATNNLDMDGTPDYISAINEIKDKSVPKEAYMKLREENKKLLNSLVNGETLQAKSNIEKPDVSKLRKKLTSENSVSNLDFIETALTLRDELISTGQRDPFLPWGKNIVPTEDDVRAANRVAEGLRQCVDYANGDSSIFTNELQRITVDTAPQYRRK